MSIRHSISRAGLALLFVLITMHSAFAQTRVSQYTLTTPTLSWNDISSSGTNFASLLRYYNYSTIGSLPFNFTYDGTSISAGTTLYVWEGAIELGGLSTPEPTSGAFGTTSLPASIVFCASYTCEGSGQLGYGCYYQTTGTAPNRVYTIQLNQVHTYDMGTPNHGYSGAPTNVQVKLFETSNVIQIIYQNHSSLFAYSGYPCSIGLDGFASPSFSYYSFATSQTKSPSTDLQFSPAPPQELSLQPKNLNFGTTNPQTPITLCVTAKSAGAAGTTLHITNYSQSGSSAFTMISGPPVGTAIPAGSSVNYCFTFLPFFNGVAQGIFTLNTDGADSGTQVVSLNGVGAVPNVSYSATNLFRGVNTRVTDTSNTLWLYVHSTGGGPLVVNTAYFIGLDASAYVITHMPPGPIGVGGVDSIGVKFIPDLEGRPDAKMVINSTGVNNPWDTVQLFGVGKLAHLAINNSYPTPVAVNFDSVKLGSDSCLQVVLLNPGSDTLAILKNYFESKDFDFAFTPLTGTDTLLPPGATKTLTVCFTPLQRGYRAATLRIMTNIPHTETNPQRDTSQFEVNFIATGVPSGSLSITGPSNQDSSAVGTAVCMVDTLWNTGLADLTVTSLSISGVNSADFSGTYPTLPLLLPSGTHQTFSVCATPSGMGSETATLSGTATSGETAQNTLLALNVFGTSNAVTAAITVPFTALTCVGDMENATVSVTNTGNIATAYSALPITGANAADFTVTSATTSPVENGGGIATFTVQFKPTTNGSETATLPISGGAGTSITLTATGGAAAIAGSGTAPTSPIGTTPVAFTATVNNTGTCEWTPGEPVSVNAPFAYVSGALTPITAGGTGTLNFTMDPSVAGNYSSPVTFSNSTGISIPASNVIVSGIVSSESVQMTSSSNGYSLDQNYPNPFGSESQLEITLPVGGMVHMTIVNVQGETVQTVLNQHFDAGSFEIKLDASNLSSGSYYYQMQVGGVTLTRQMVVVK